MARVSHRFVDDEEVEDEGASLLTGSETKTRLSYHADHDALRTPLLLGLAVRLVCFVVGGALGWVLLSRGLPWDR